jgi:hypothetical protein
MKQIIEQFVAFEKEFDSSKQVVKEKFELISDPADASQLSIQRELGRIEPSVLDFYEVANGIKVQWKAADQKFVNEEMIGSVKINPFSQVVKDWSGVVFFDKDGADSPRRKFFPLDFFADEAAAGFCTKEGMRDMIYLYRFEGDLIPLYVNFSSYLQLLLQAKGCYYWQYLIVAIVDKNENAVSERIRQFLPQVFPDFDFNRFRDLFEKLMIKK